MGQCLLGFSGHAQAGKSYASMYSQGWVLAKKGIIEDFAIKDDLLHIKPPNEDWVPIDPVKIPYEHPEKQRLYYDLIGRHVDIISFADELKSFCINILGLSFESVYGTNDQKNAETHLNWEDFKHIKIKGPKKTGPMSGRDVMQFVGTELFRSIDPDIWVKAWKRRVERSGSEIIIAPDVRFPNEVLAITESQGKVIRLMRTPIESAHESETALDKDKFDWNLFHASIDNQNTTIKEFLDNVGYILYGLGWIKEESDG